MTSAENTIPWDQLLADISKRQVLTIIGPALVTVDVGGHPLPLIDAIVPDFAKEHDIEHKSGMTLNEAACKFLEREGQGKRMAIYNTVTRLINNRAQSPVPQALLDLVAITDFDVFVTTTFDGFFTRALTQARPGWSPTKGRAVLHPTSVVDVPQPLPGTFLYHILGATDQHSSFAIWEEDYMEYLAALLMGPQDNLKNLIGLLRNRSLLLIGSPFHDWFVRFFLFIAKRSGIAVRNDATGAYLADSFHADHPLVFYFDKVIGCPRVLPIDPCTFVRELRQRWSAANPSNSLSQVTDLPTEMKKGFVFISYASEDKDAAFEIAIGLHNAGIPVWLDKARLKAGTEWEKALRIAIKQRAALFLSVISPSTESIPAVGDGETEKRIVMRERQWAETLYEEGFVFYIPVFIGQGSISNRREPPKFRGEHCHKLPEGIVTPKFLELIDSYLTEYRTNDGVIHAN